MTWNYRLTYHHSYDSLPEDDDIVYRSGKVWEIREVYYDSAGNIVMYSVRPISLMGETRWELLGDMWLQFRAFFRPPIDIEQLEKEIKERFPDDNSGIN